MPSTALRSYMFLSVLPAASLFACAVFGQVEEQFRNLIIDPVLLDEAGEVLVGVDTKDFNTPGVQRYVSAGNSALPDENDTTVFQEEITAIERRDGQYSSALVEQLLALGREYQQQDKKGNFNGQM